MGASLSMGGVAVWSMHFVGNRAVDLDTGAPAHQISYNVGFTVGSFLLAVLIMGVAFWIFSLSDVVSLARVLGGGTINGLGICGMHYLGQGGIANYTPIYDWRFIVAAVIVAVTASSAALGYFFYFTSLWRNAWYRRLGCATALAAAVSGMHWTATAGTAYRFMRPSKESKRSRRAIIVVVACLVIESIYRLLIEADERKAILSCVGLLTLAALRERSRLRSVKKARSIALASATFDGEGRILVTTAGLLPCQKVTNGDIERVSRRVNSAGTFLIGFFSRP